MNVLLGVAGGDESIAALEETIERTRAAGDTLTVAVVDADHIDRSPEELSQYVTDHLENADIDATVERLEGDPGSSLVEYAERGEFDQLVIGGGTLSPMGKIQLGPLTEFVLLNSPITVKLIR